MFVINDSAITDFVINDFVINDSVITEFRWIYDLKNRTQLFYIYVQKSVVKILVRNESRRRCFFHDGNFLIQLTEKKWCHYTCSNISLCIELRLRLINIYLVCIFKMNHLKFYFLAFLVCVIVSHLWSSLVNMNNS